MNDLELNLLALGSENNICSVEHQANGDRLQINTRADGTKQRTLHKTNGETVTTQAHGSKITTKKGPDPRFNMQSPITTASTILLPSGLQSETTASRTVELTDPADPLSLAQQTTRQTVNGKTTTRVYDAETGTLITTTPQGRKSTQTLDDNGRITSIATPSLATTYLNYDDRGRLRTLTQGSGTEARTNTITYDALGNIKRVVNPLGEVTAYGYDPVGRILKQTNPDNAKIGFGYDANGNTTAITPPEKPRVSVIKRGPGLRKNNASMLPMVVDSPARAESSRAKPTSEVMFLSCSHIWIGCPPAAAGWRW